MACYVSVQALTGPLFRYGPQHRHHLSNSGTNRRRRDCYNCFGSGGGFSWDFSGSEAPYQSEAVKGYLTQAEGLPPQGSYPPAGRPQATPAVAALAEGYQVMQNGQVGPASWTSASTPALAGMILLLNEARLQAGKKPIAFLTIFCTKPLSFHGYHTRRRIVRIQLYQRVGPCNCNGFTAIPQRCSRQQ